MMQSNTDIKQINRKNVLSYIYTQRSTTQKSIKDTLQLSRSTIVQILKELEDQRLILRGEVLESTGGRPATSPRRPQARARLCPGGHGRPQAG